MVPKLGAAIVWGIGPFSHLGDSGSRLGVPARSGQSWRSLSLKIVLFFLREAPINFNFKRNSAIIRFTPPYPPPTIPPQANRRFVAIFAEIYFDSGNGQTLFLDDIVMDIMVVNGEI